MDPVIVSSQQKFIKIIDLVKSDLATIRTGKASSHLIENVVAEAYGTKMKLLELASISVTDGSTLMVTAFDAANIGPIAKAIQEANLGLTAVPQGTVVRVIVPPLSAERRQEYVKLAKTKAESGKVMVRQTRHEAMEEISNMETDEDTKKALEKEIQKITDQTIEKLDLIVTEKEKELVQI